MRKFISHYQDSKAMTHEMVQWLADASSHGCTGIVLSANCSLGEEASTALVDSVAAKTIASLEFHEIYFTPEQLQAMLAMPALEELKIWGGESYDWNGPKYVWETLDMAHMNVLMSSPHAQRLHVLEIGNQNFSESLGERLRAALPNLRTLRVEGEEY
jgi:hypothetical protein